jgi:predicted alpha/beta hydrolase
LAVVQQFKVRTSDGVSLTGSIFRPEVAAGQKPAVMISSASGVPRRYYEYFARFLCDQREMTVVTYDYRGIGESLVVNIRQDTSRLSDWGLADFPAILDWLSNNVDTHHFVAIGHSIGGHLVGMAPNNKLLSAAVTIASQDGYWKILPFPANFRRYLEWLVALPVVVKIFGCIPSGLAGEALPKNVALEWAEWCRDRQYFAHNLGPDTEKRFLEFDKPYLFYTISDDEIAPRVCCESLIDAYQNAKVERREIKPSDWGLETIGHFGFFRKSAPPSAWEEVSTWIEKQCLVTP